MQTLLTKDDIHGHAFKRDVNNKGGTLLVQNEKSFGWNKIKLYKK